MKLSLTVALQKKKVATTFEAQENAFQVTSSILTLNSWPKQNLQLFDDWSSLPPSILWTKGEYETIKSEEGAKVHWDKKLQASKLEESFSWNSLLQKKFHMFSKG